MALKPGITPVCDEPVIGGRHNVTGNWTMPGRKGKRTFPVFSPKAPISKSVDLQYLVVTILHGADQLLS